MNKIIVLGVLIGVLFSQNIQAATTTDAIALNIEETFNRVIDFIVNDLFGIVKGIFKEKVIPLWEKMYEWFKENIWAKIKPLTEAEIERRKQIAEEESQAEKDEIIEEMEEISIKNDIWGKIKTFLIKLWN